MNNETEYGEIISAECKVCGASYHLKKSYEVGMHLVFYPFPCHHGGILADYRKEGKQKNIMYPEFSARKAWNIYIGQISKHPEILIKEEFRKFGPMRDAVTCYNCLTDRIEIHERVIPVNIGKKETEIGHKEYWTGLPPYLTPLAEWCHMTLDKAFPHIKREDGEGDEDYAERLYEAMVGEAEVAWVEEYRNAVENTLDDIEMAPLSYIHSSEYIMRGKAGRIRPTVQLEGE